MISVVIPAYNEKGAIASTVRQVRDVLQRAALADVEILVIDDGSTDETGTCAGDAGAKVIRHPHNIGYGRAIKTGILAAAHDTIVIADADGTYPIETIPELIAKYQEGFDMVVGQRTGEVYQGSALKWPMRLLLRFLVEWTAGRTIPDINSGLRVFSRKTVSEYLNHLCDTFSFTTSLTLAYMMTARFVTYIPIVYRERIGRTKVSLWRDSMRTLQFILQAITYYNPIKLFLLLAICCIAVSVGSLAVGIVFRLATAFLLAVGATLMAVLVIALGLVADLLRQIMAKQG